MSREKQIEEMANDYYEIMLKAAKSFGTMSQGVSKFYARHLYEKGYRKHEWISVDERLPEDQQMVLTIDTEGEMQVCFYETEWEGIFQQCHGLVQIYNITHWMPLPEPPKMKGGAE